MSSPGAFSEAGWGTTGRAPHVRAANRYRASKAACDARNVAKGEWYVPRRQEDNRDQMALVEVELLCIFASRRASSRSIRYRRPCLRSIATRFGPSTSEIGLSLAKS